MGEKKLDISEWSRWYLVKDKDKSGNRLFKIRRYRTVDSKVDWERYPSKNYCDMTEIEINSLMIRLNATRAIDAKAAESRYVFDHSYINQISMGKFEKHIQKKTDNKGTQLHIIQMLEDYVFEFFILQCKIPDPSRWYLKEDEWGDFLLNMDLSPGSIKRIISTANRLNKFLVQKVYPEMPTPRQLEPIGKVIFDKLQADRAKTEKVKTKFINAEMFEKMIKAAEKSKYSNVIPNMKLCYAFGFRINETLGLTKGKFLKDSIVTDEQGDRVIESDNGEKEVSRKKVKTTSRRIPYWNMNAREAWALVQQVAVMHPSTLNRRMNTIMGQFGHSSHDFRRTFITNSFRKGNHWKDVMKAAGHRDVRTTMIYDQDDRNFNDDKADLD